MGHIYWIASYPKSGNTWMRSLLGRLVLGEEGALNQLWSFAPDENYGPFYDELLPRPIAEASMAEQAAARPLAQARIAEKTEGFQFLKTHAMLARHAGTPTVNAAVTAGAIYLVRNPLDVAVSYSAFRGGGLDETIAILNARGRIMPRNFRYAYVPSGSWSENVLSWTHKPHDRLLVLRYEDLLADPQAELARTARFLKLDASPDAIGAAVTASSFETLEAQERAEGFVERPEMTEKFFRRGEANQWREILSERQVAAVVRPNRAAMIAMGYWDADFDGL